MRTRLLRLFKPAARYPADPRAVFILVLSVFTGSLALSLESGPKTLESVLPEWAVLAWGVTLVLGSAVTLLGMANQTLNGILVEQVGSVVVGATTVFYSGIALSIAGTSALQSVGIIFAWGVACFIRWGQLQVLVNQAYRDKIRTEVANTIRVETSGSE